MSKRLDMVLFVLPVLIFELFGLVHNAYLSSRLESSNFTQAD